jgi:hypothetical protein
MNNTHHRIAFVSRLAVSALKQSALLTAVSLRMVCGVLADDIAISEQSFSCINDWPKIRNTHIYNADPEKLKEAIQNDWQVLQIRCSRHLEPLGGRW